MKLDCKIPDAEFASCTFGNTLIIEAIMQRIKLNVIKNMCKPQPGF